MSFDATGLDPRLLRALSKRGFEKPTPVQVGLHAQQSQWILQSVREQYKKHACVETPQAAPLPPPLLQARVMPPKPPLLLPAVLLLSASLPERSAWSTCVHQNCRRNAFPRR